MFLSYPMENLYRVTSFYNLLLILKAAAISLFLRYPRRLICDEKIYQYRQFTFFFRANSSENRDNLRHPLNSHYLLATKNIAICCYMSLCSSQNGIVGGECTHASLLVNTHCLLRLSTNYNQRSVRNLRSLGYISTCRLFNFSFSTQPVRAKLTKTVRTCHTHALYGQEIPT